MSTAALAQVGRELPEASLMSGASQGMTFLRVTLPLMLPGLAAAWVLLFVMMSLLNSTVVLLTPRLTRGGAAG